MKYRSKDQFFEHALYISAMQHAMALIDSNNFLLASINTIISKLLRLSDFVWAHICYVPTHICFFLKKTFSSISGSYGGHR